MKVGIIGSGVVGQTLAAGFVKHGHQVESAPAIPPS
jgi:predicted dinucleotide-binding enzyme